MPHHQFIFGDLSSEHFLVLMWVGKRQPHRAIHKVKQREAARKDEMNRQIDSSSDIFRARESIRTMQRKVEEHNKERDNTGVRVNVRACLRGRSDDVLRTSTAVVPALPSESVPLPGPKERDNGRET